MNQEEHDHHHHINTKQLSKAFVATLGFMFIEFFGGLYTNSIALTSDAFHMLTDATALGLSLLASYLMLKKKSLKIEVMAAFLNGIFLATLAVFILIEAVHRLQNPAEIKPLETLIIGCIGLAFNLFVLRFLSHAHADNLNVKSAMLHVAGDLIGSIGVVIAAILYWLGFKMADPIVSILVGGLILFSVGVLVKQALKVRL